MLNLNFNVSQGRSRRRPPHRHRATAGTPRDKATKPQQHRLPRPSQPKTRAVACTTLRHVRHAMRKMAPLDMRTVRRRSSGWPSAFLPQGDAARPQRSRLAKSTLLKPTTKAKTSTQLPVRSGPHLILQTCRAGARRVLGETGRCPTPLRRRPASPNTSDQRRNKLIQDNFLSHGLRQAGLALHNPRSPCPDTHLLDKSSATKPCASRWPLGAAPSLASVRCRSAARSRGEALQRGAREKTRAPRRQPCGIMRRSDSAAGAVSASRMRGRGLKPGLCEKQALPRLCFFQRLQDTQWLRSR